MTAAVISRASITTPTSNIIDQIITSNGFPLLAHAGSISHEQMETQTSALYLDYDQRRKTQEAQTADQDDEADLKAIEAKIKRRPKK